ncbi:transcriptional regulator of acetoin/glycerol metabolism [Chromobacterium alkanivorans]|uniref:sigma-54-dependent Fis family transcriptional regulator n=1 Tax=Chromobacterium alkanivorans TaxID=1071719 RepID=UPI002167FDBC|nr:sigma-54-dependent Fis family transcriptional regulator [Chromobacterium alkanivorans]MCS3805961.1 transcriptional regulator of acetoin/glycerol metabolism [Chromobacterium alkanivorans]MCS3820299.1 transcriptional regulator of acetoin/glycerol metabolism [Chromobacterium alkanivorans]MCS3875057.1 transcriptional regulator of acetoin/glycerol metabolism [Chromobacterium alkanivorans]
MDHPIASPVERARRSFFQQGLAPAGLRGEIAQSWQRCRQQALPPQGARRQDGLESAALNALREANGLLLRLAQPELDGLGEQVVDRRGIVLLSDADGVILNAAGCPGFLPKAEQVALLPGMAWGERDRGTNAIGTALALGAAVQVNGGEHYLASNGGISCSAAPIFAPNGRLAGALNISSDARAHDAHALGLVRLAARQIEHRWLARPASEHWLVRFHLNHALLGSPREGVLVFADEVLVEANSCALAWLGLAWADLGRARFGQLFDGELQPADGLRTRLGRRGQHFHLHITPPASQAPTERQTPKADAAARPSVALQRAVKVLNADIPVLLQGETGVGKEVFARALHAASRRGRGPFVAVNCAAIPEALIESELFGYEEGAFTGARRKGMTGKLREADGGVLFLDEVGDMPAAMQARLLRALQQREVTPLGGGRTQAVDFALVCATHRDLAAMTAAGEFRADLFYRLQDYPVRLPPLRERDDLPLLIDEIWDELGAARRGVRLGGPLRAALLACSWPGNARQLHSALRTMLALADDGAELGIEDLPAGCRAEAPTLSPTLAAGRDDLIEQTLARCQGNVSRAAAELGVARSTVYRRLRGGGR